MKVLLTGATGFLGKIIYQELVKHNEMITVSRIGSSICVDLANVVPILPNVDMVVHCAGKAHSVPRSILEEQSFFNINLNGTSNLLKGLEKLTSLPKSFVFISTVAVYGKEMGEMIDEEEALLAKDAYGESKIEAEKLVQIWCKERNVVCTILRLPLIAGVNPPGNLKSMIAGIKRGYYFNVERGRARKSVVMGKDVASIIPKAALIGGIYNLTDGYNPSFYELSKIIALQLNRPNSLNLPKFIVKSIGFFGDIFGLSFVNTNKFSKMTNDLTFSDLKARKSFGWSPHLVLKEFKI